MAQDPEKRFHSIMEKLYHSPKSTPSSASSPPPRAGGQRQVLRGKKRPNPSAALALGEVAGEAPLCRPWDRGDFLRRLSTFKSMTWFAKPKVVSAVNCARRGWINVDMDIIACESCGARLLFSTPPPWNQQQVEKAALVFSLKLDSGHKLLCPWIDNACDERLAEFPPTMPADLVDKFRERSNSLFQLLALPVVSSSAIEFMRSSQLEEFLKQPLMVESQKGNPVICQLEPIEDGSDMVSANLYYQAQKLISLCGWEPRSLPYVVDCKDGPNQFSKEADILRSSQGVDYERNLSLSFHAADGNENLETNEEFESSCRLQYDPKSVVLDCRLCGASVGLWAFSTVQQPVEFFRLVGYADVNPGFQDSGHDSNANDRVVSVASSGDSSSIHQSSNLKLTIAGGPPPTRQNFKATISVPVIGQSLRSRLSFLPEFGDQVHNNQEDSPEKFSTDCLNNSTSEQIVPLEDLRTLNSKKDDQVNCNFKSNDQPPCSNHDASARDDIFRHRAPLEGTSLTVEENSPRYGTYDSNMRGQDSCRTNNTPEKVDNVKSCDLAIKDSGTVHVGESPVTTQDANVSSRNAGTKDNDSSVMITSEKFCQEQIAETGKVCNKKDSGTVHVGESSVTTEDANVSSRNAGSEDNDSSVTITSEKFCQEKIAETDKVCNKDVSLVSHQESTCAASFLEADVNVDGKCKMNTRENNTCSDAPNANNEEGTTSGVQIVQNNKVLAGAKGKDLKQLHTDKMTEFDPIRQHRHFCPWIVSTGSREPGWQQTLSALLRGKVPHSTPISSPSSVSVIKVDDPIASVKKLFLSPSAKRTKNNLESS